MSNDFSQFKVWWWLLISKTFIFRQDEDTICPVDRQDIDMTEVCLNSISQFLVQPEYFSWPCFNLMLFSHLQFLLLFYCSQVKSQNIFLNIRFFVWYLRLILEVFWPETVQINACHHLCEIMVTSLQYYFATFQLKFALDSWSGIITLWLCSWIRESVGLVSICQLLQITKSPINKLITVVVTTLRTTF